MEEKVMSQEDFERVKKLRQEFTELTYKFGRLYLDKTILTKQAQQLDDVNTELDSEYESLNLKEVNLMKELEEKYGKCTLDLETGKIIEN